MGPAALRDERLRRRSGVPPSRHLALPEPQTCIHPLFNYSAPSRLRQKKKKIRTLHTDSRRQPKAPAEARLSELEEDSRPPPA